MVRILSDVRGQKRGQAVVLIALMAVALVAFVGLALDGGQVVDRRRGMQNAADAGAIAGAYQLGLTTTASVIAGAVQSYTVSITVGNGADSWQANYLPSGIVVNTTNTPVANDSCVVVTTTVGFQTYFIGIVGFNVLTTTASATACGGSVTNYSGDGMLPLSIMTTSFQYDVDYCFFDQAGGPPPPSCSENARAPGSFGWISLDGSSGGNVLKDQIDGGFSGQYHYSLVQQSSCITPLESSELPLPAWLCTTNGAKASDLHELNIIVNTIRIIPIYDRTNDQPGGNLMYHFVKFAAFEVTNVIDTGNPKYVIGRFVEYVVPGQICRPGVVGCPTGTSLKAIQLIR